jgi:ribosomal protein L13
VDNLVLPNIYATYKYKAPLIGPNPLYSLKVDRHQEKMVQDMITKNLSIDPALLSLQAYEANFRNHHKKSNHTLSLKESQ